MSHSWADIWVRSASFLVDRPFPSGRLNFISSHQSLAKIFVRKLSLFPRRCHESYSCVNGQLLGGCRFWVWAVHGREKHAEEVDIVGKAAAIDSQQMQRWKFRTRKCRLRNLMTNFCHEIESEHPVLTLREELNGEGRSTDKKSYRSNLLKVCH